MNERLLREIVAALPYMTLAEREEVSALLERVHPAPPPKTFKEYVAAVAPEYRWYRHNNLIHDRLMDVMAGKIKRLAIFMPPRHSKSMTVSQLFAGYYQYCYPQRWVGLAAYNDALAGYHTNHAKTFLQRITNAFSDPRELAHVRVSLSSRGGGMWCSGTGGSTTGLGAHLLIGDDLVKNSAEAASPTIQARNIEWWDTTFTTRKQPGAALVICMTRWHPKDITAYMMKMAAAGAQYEGTGWHILPFDAIRDSTDPWDFPTNCTIEQDWRADGEALAPEMFPINELLVERSTKSPHSWAALYQQRPRAKDGNVFKVHMITRVKHAPADAYAIVRYWDTASTSAAESMSGDPDYTAGVRISVTGYGLSRKWCVEDVVAEQFEPVQRNALLKVTADRDALERGMYRVQQRMESQAGQGGKDATAAMISAMAPHSVEARPAPGASKELRAEPFATQVNAGNVTMVEGPWNERFLLWLGAFPFGAHDDEVDAAAGAFNELEGMPADVTVAAVSTELTDPYDA